MKNEDKIYTSDELVLDSTDEHLKKVVREIKELMKLWKESTNAT